MFRLKKLIIFSITSSGGIVLALADKELLIILTIFNGFSFISGAITDLGHIPLNNNKKFINESIFKTRLTSRLRKYSFLANFILLGLFAIYLNNIFSFSYGNSLLLAFLSFIGGYVLTLLIRWKYVTRRLKQYNLAFNIGDFLSPILKFILILIFCGIKYLDPSNLNSNFELCLVTAILFITPHLLAFLIGNKRNNIQNIQGKVNYIDFKWSRSSAIFSVITAASSNSASLVTGFMPLEISFIYAIFAKFGNLLTISCSNIIAQLPRYFSNRRFITNRFNFSYFCLSIIGTFGFILFSKIFNLNINFINSFLLNQVILLPSLGGLYSEYLQVKYNPNSAFKFELISIIASMFCFLIFKLKY